MNRHGNIKGAEITGIWADEIYAVDPVKQASIDALEDDISLVDIIVKGAKPLKPVENITFTAVIQNDPSFKMGARGAYDYTKETWKRRGNKK